MDEWMDGLTDGCMERWMDGRMDGWMDVGVGLGVGMVGMGRLMLLLLERLQPEGWRMGVLVGLLSLKIWEGACAFVPDKEGRGMGLCSCPSAPTQQNCRESAAHPRWACNIFASCN
eukprot:289803-Chlamydomonas_euryale.AAC.5